jgi:uroporphyrinogen decarboxylase
MAPAMTHRDRVRAAISCRQPDCVPIDLASTRVSSMVVEGYERLKLSMGVSVPTQLCDRMMRAVRADESVLKRLDIDTRAVYIGDSAEKPAVELEGGGYRDCWGVERFRPPGCYYYEQRSYPLSGEISVADLARYPWPSPDDAGAARGLRERVEWIRANTDCAAVLTLPAPFVHTSQYLRGFEDWYMDFMLNTPLLEAMFDAVLEVNMAWARRELEAVGKDVDVVICSDDMGTQSGLQVSPEHYLRYIKPRHAKFFGMVHELTPAKLMLHCCGSVASIIDDLAQTGVDCLNPVQITAAGMDPVELKRNHRGKMAFWGAMDTQNVLPRGTQADVRRMVEERIEQMGEGGGYVLAPCHNIQPDVPVENILAMYEHARQYVPSYMK